MQITKRITGGADRDKERKERGIAGLQNMLRMSVIKTKYVKIKVVLIIVVRGKNRKVFEHQRGV